MLIRECFWKRHLRFEGYVARSDMEGNVRLRSRRRVANDCADNDVDIHVRVEDTSRLIVVAEAYMKSRQVDTYTVCRIYTLYI
jgi:hypothetical protein